MDGVSLLQGRKVAGGDSGWPATLFLGHWYADNELSLHDQLVANGAFTNPHRGQHGSPDTAADDVIVDGRVITGENFDSAPLLGRVLAAQILSIKN